MDTDFTVLHFELLSFWILPTVWHSKQNIFQNCHCPQSDN